MYQKVKPPMWAFYQLLLRAAAFARGFFCLLAKMGNFMRFLFLRPISVFSSYPDSLDLFVINKYLKIEEKNKLKKTYLLVSEYRLNLQHPSLHANHHELLFSFPLTNSDISYFPVKPVQLNFRKPLVSCLKISAHTYSEKI